MTSSLRDTTAADGQGGKVADLLFWLAVAALVLGGAFFLRHDFTACDPTYEFCGTD